MQRSISSHTTTTSPARRHDPSRARVAALASLGVLIAILGCIDETNSGFGPVGGTGSVAGTVQGAPFSQQSGVAELVGQSYFVTLADAPGYGCATTPTGPYKKVVFQITGTGSVDAANNVTFILVEGAVENTEPASGGSVTVSEIDESFGSVRGTLSATGTSSDISGAFDLPICD